MNVFRITGASTNPSGYWRINVTYVSGGTVPANNEILSINFSRTGNIGAQGNQGIQGTFGGVGSQGTQGTTGAQGNQGIQGIAGSQGNQGIQGNNANVQGTTGAQGNQGIQGISGAQGNQGIQGRQGTQGIQGIQGNNANVQGTTGAQGNQGIQGITGSQGNQGIQGITGSQGNQGIQGITGSQGNQGIQGITGAQGTSGPNTIINAANDTSSTTLYPTMVAAAGLNQTIKVTTTSGYFTFDASTGVLSTTASKARYADLAEAYISDKKYESGTVLEFGGEYEVTISRSDMSTKVAGVVSTNPAYLMNSELKAENIAVIALQGRVPTKVIGSVKKGDLMISASDGYARACNNSVVGSVIGKALENFQASDTNQTSIIEIVIGKC
jgi:hypothetical protein